MTDEWFDREALVTVKAYPTPSKKHFETTCIAAVTREEGWVRLYPVSYRSLPEDQQFAKYQHIYLRMTKHDRDARPESYRPDEHSIRLGKSLYGKDKWRLRWHWIQPTLGPTMCELQRLQESEGRSLGCIKPREVDDLVVEETDEQWSDRKQAILDQKPLFDTVASPLEKIPLIFKYRYRCESPDCRGHRQSIQDWELGQLFRNVKADTLDRDEIIAKVRGMFLDEMCNRSKDTYFFVGNHSRFPVTFMVLGVFWPPRSHQPDLF